MQISEEQIIKELGIWRIAVNSETGENAVWHSGKIVAGIQRNESFGIFLGSALVVREVVPFKQEVVFVVLLFQSL